MRFKGDVCFKGGLPVPVCLYLVISGEIFKWQDLPHTLSINGSLLFNEVPFFKDSSTTRSSFVTINVRSLKSFLRF